MNEAYTEKAFVLLSGGIDSAVCLQIALDEHDQVAAVHFNYGQQTADIEHQNARSQADSAGINLYTLDYREVFGQFAEGTIQDKTYSREQQTENGHSVGYVPQRNLHLLTSTAAVAEHHSAKGTKIVLYFGAQQGDEEDYPDCRPEFIKNTEQTLNCATDNHDISLQAPIITLSKRGVLKKGEQLGVDWEKTFSCYNPKNSSPCGECPACLERREAFAQTNISDPVEQ
jgi:7-cyano-7-deazaguanine synthase